MDDYPQLLLCNQLCFPLYAASKALVRRYDPYLMPLGLTYTQYIVLLVLWEKEEIDVKELGETVSLDSGTLSPLLLRLEEKGYIQKKRVKDGRYRLISLTDKGVLLREEAKDIPFKIGSCLNLEREEAKALYDSCKKIIEICGENDGQ